MAWWYGYSDVSSRVSLHSFCTKALCNTFQVEAPSFHVQKMLCDGGRHPSPPRTHFMILKDTLMLQYGTFNVCGSVVCIPFFSGSDVQTKVNMVNRMKYVDVPSSLHHQLALFLLTRANFRSRTCRDVGRSLTSQIPNILSMDIRLGY
jgi:hypothetical protein